MFLLFYVLFFFFNDTATTEIYTLSLHDALPISKQFILIFKMAVDRLERHCRRLCDSAAVSDRKSTRLNSSHTVISYAVFCLKKKKRGGPEVNPITHVKAEHLHRCVADTAYSSLA